MKWLCIANPGAGDNGSATRALKLVERFGLAMDHVASTTGAGDGLAHARRASGFEGIVVVGGDGTIAEVLAGMDRARQTLAIIPTGHGNCLARSLGLNSVATAVDALRRPRVRVVDLVEAVAHRSDGECTTLLSASTLAFGYVSDVVALGRTRLARLGRYAYAAGALLTRPRWLEAAISVDGTPVAKDRFTSIIVNNSDYLANFRAFPNGRLDDGRLDVMAIRVGWARQMLHNVSVLSGRYFYDPTRTWQPTSVRIEVESPELLMVDGEFIPGVVALEARCLRSAVQCVGAGA